MKDNNPKHYLSCKKIYCVLMIFIIASILRWIEIKRPLVAYARVYYDIGRKYDEAGQIANAVNAYERAIHHDPLFDEATYYLALDYRKSGNMNRTLELHQQLVKMNSEIDPEVYYEVGMDLVKKDQFEEARLLFEKAIKLKPAYGQAYFQLAHVYVHKKKFKRALEYYRLACRSNPNYVEAMAELIPLECKIGKKYEAIDYWDILKNLNQPELVNSLEKVMKETKCFENKMEPEKLRVDYLSTPDY